MKFSMTSHGRIRGFSLTETVIVLGLIGLVLGAIWAALANVSQKQKVAAAIGDLQYISTNIKALYAAHMAFSSAAQTDITCNLVSAGVFPADLIAGPCTAGNTSTYPITRWGPSTNVIVYSSTSAPDAGSGQFEVQFYPIPGNACLALLGQLVGPAQSMGITYLFGGSVGWQQVTGTSPTISTFTDGCGTGSSNFSTDWKLKG